MIKGGKRKGRKGDTMTLEIGLFTSNSSGGETISFVPAEDERLSSFLYFTWKYLWERSFQWLKISNLFWSRWWKFTHQLRSKLFEQITKSVLVNKTNICRLKLFWNIKRSLYSWVVNHLTLGTKCDDSNSLFFKEVSWCALLYQDHNGEE